VNKSLARLALLIATASPLVAVAQKAPETRPTAQKPDVPPLERLLPEVNFNGNALGDVIDFLRDVTGFNIVLVRPQGMDAGNDPAVTLRLKNASLGQVLAVLTRECPIEVSTVPANRPGEGEITVVKIVGTPTPAADPGPGVVVRVYHIRSITEALLAGRPAKHPAATQPDGGGSGQSEQLFGRPPPDVAALRGALNDVLSLCKAALDQVRDTAGVVLQVHEPTQTLIFKGRPEQQAALEDVLNALDPNRAEPSKAVVRPSERAAAAQAQMVAQVQDTVKREREETEARVNQMAERSAERLQEARQRNDELQARLAKQQEQMLEFEREIERLKIRLEAADKARGDAGGATGAPGDSKGKDSGGKQ
jgi:hypothetical protein